MDAIGERFCAPSCTNKGQIRCPGARLVSRVSVRSAGFLRLRRGRTESVMVVSDGERSVKSMPNQAKELTEKSYLVLTAVGPDRPGIVSELSALIHRAGANVED